CARLYVTWYFEFW
nr:immunoglobulin heavy chain junction region [Macaca mulatta]MOX92468.1 immunoglobulin heavy chain junction region [Macaca mulatta]MOX92597.1 immunoglobulin heavy chain junction region [Macaca mulatta]MOX92666.1 immunoglobulin heavy chain junction region [Macaca mulatta]MOX92858.1 immunoglobulin heavy chain junction region [Macaca mulatta]